MSHKNMCQAYCAADDDRKGKIFTRTESCYSVDSEPNLEGWTSNATSVDASNCKAKTNQYFNLKGQEVTCGEGVDCTTCDCCTGMTNFCKNGGTAVAEEKVCRCSCPSGWGGSTCEEKDCTLQASYGNVGQIIPDLNVLQGEACDMGSGTLRYDTSCRYKCDADNGWFPQTGTKDEKYPYMAYCRTGGSVVEHPGNAWGPPLVCVKDVTALGTYVN